MANETKKPWYVSSTGGGLSLTLAGISLEGAAQIVAFIASQFGFNVGENEVTIFAQSVVAAISAVMIVVGTLRKVYIAVKARFSGA